LCCSTIKPTQTDDFWWDLFDIDDDYSIAKIANTSTTTIADKIANSADNVIVVQPLQNIGC
jgi:hypothetical protein